MKRPLVLGFAALGGICFFFAVAGGVWLRSSLPQVDGTKRLAGIQSTVEIIRDRNGVPRIFADSEEDAHFALGFVHAQDRLWQLESQRRLVTGRLSEIMGAPTRRLDRMFRTFGLHLAAESSLAVLDGPTRAALSAYAAGVNAFVDSRGSALPVEFLLVGASAPEPWRPSDSLSILKLMSWRLTPHWRNDLLRARLLDRLTPQQIEELWPPYPPGGPVTLSEWSIEIDATVRTLSASLLNYLPPIAQGGIGSNAWVVAGGRSASGRPLLANDPHLPLASPNTWYLAQLNAPNLSVTGATLPGLPFVVLGHTRQVAWGFTNTNTDVQDIFIERSPPSNPDHYLSPDGPLKFNFRKEIIKIKGLADDILMVRESRHGPIISDLVARPASVSDAHLALAWTALLNDDLTPQAGLKLNRAANWADFVDAIRDFHGPQQNIVYADADGNIGTYTPGRVPIRKRGNGRFPVPGWTGEYDWRGFVPFPELPHAFNPLGEAFVNANNKVIPEGYPHHLTDDWGPPFRALRIEHLLAAREQHTAADFRDMQADTISLMARLMLPHLMAATPETVGGRSAKRLLDGWGGNMNRDASQPVIFWAWYRDLSRMVYEDELGTFFYEFWHLRSLFMDWILNGGGSHWCDDTRTSIVESCHQLAGLALDSAVADLSRRHGKNPGNWRWGDVHRVQLKNPLLDQIPFLGAYLAVTVENGGDPYTVNAGGYAWTDDDHPFSQIHGPSLRAIYDFSDLDQSLFIHPPGQSGNPLSPHFNDLTTRWRDHVPFRIAAGNEVGDGDRRLILIPAAGD